MRDELEILSAFTGLVVERLYADRQFRRAGRKKQRVYHRLVILRSNGRNIITGVGDLQRL